MLNGKANYDKTLILNKDLKVITTRIFPGNNDVLADHWFDIVFQIVQTLLKTLARWLFLDTFYNVPIIVSNVDPRLDQDCAQSKNNVDPILDQYTGPILGHSVNQFSYSELTQGQTNTVHNEKTMLSQYWPNILSLYWHKVLPQVAWKY